MMVTTRDGHTLHVDDKYFVVLLAENGEYIEKSAQCYYKGICTKDNRLLLDSLPVGCSGVSIPETENVHCFEPIDPKDEVFELIEYDVKNAIIRDLSNTEVVTKTKLKSN